MNNRKVVLYISMSLDGYIATKDNDFGFLLQVEKEGEDYGYNEFIATVDTVIIGRKTFDKVLSMGIDYPHNDKDVFIITKNEKPSIGTFQFYSGDLSQLIRNLKNKPGKNIYCDGGAEIVHLLLTHKLIDEMIISIIPILLGDGIKLFKENQPKQSLNLISEKGFEKGLVQLHYSCN